MDRLNASGAQLRSLRSNMVVSKCLRLKNLRCIRTRPWHATLCSLQHFLSG